MLSSSTGVGGRKNVTMTSVNDCSGDFVTSRGDSFLCQNKQKQT